MKSAVVTGHTRGLGQAIVSYLRQQGLRVTGGARTAAPPERVDIVEYSQVEAWAQRILQCQGPPDLLICNAGLTNTPAELWKIEPAEFSRIVDVNLKGTYHTLRAFLPAMVASQSGIVVIMSSDWGTTTSAWMAPYCSTKFAMEGLVQALAQDLPKGMAAIALHPGTIDTDMLRTVFDDAARYYATPQVWIETAGPLILSLGPEHNGRSIEVPGFGD